MSVSEKRKEYWAAIHRIQAENGCDTATAKQLYRSNGRGKPSLESLTITQIADAAENKVAAIRAELDELAIRSKELSEELGQWQRLMSLAIATPAVAAAS